MGQKSALWDNHKLAGHAAGVVPWKGTNEPVCSRWRSGETNLNLLSRAQQFRSGNNVRVIGLDPAAAGMPASTLDDIVPGAGLDQNPVMLQSAGNVLEAQG